MMTERKQRDSSLVAALSFVIVMVLQTGEK